jgi:hypothetical protein
MNVEAELNYRDRNAQRVMRTGQTGPREEFE